jgi:hypothetical protein
MPEKVWLATIELAPGETLGFAGNVSVDDAVAALQEHSFRESYEPEKYRAEREAERLRLLFCLPDKSGERWP